MRRPTLALSSSPPGLRRPRLHGRFHPVPQPGDQFTSVVDARSYHLIGIPVFIEIRVQPVHRSVQSLNRRRIIRLLRQVHRYIRQVRMRPVSPSPLLGNGFEVVRHRTPRLLRRLRKGSALELIFGVSEKPLARLCMVCYFSLCHLCFLMSALPHSPFQADAQQLLGLHGELERKLLENAPAEPVDNHVVGFFVVDPALLAVEELVVTHL